MLDELIQYLSAHPGVMTAIVVTALLAVVGYIVWDGVLLTPVFAGLVLIVVGVVVALMVRPSYTVRITDTAGTVTPISFAKAKAAANIANTLTRAVAKRR